jgi:hypothetical protein
LPLFVRAVDFKANTLTVVERAWLQTWLAGDLRQDRAVFRIRTSGDQAVVELPPGVESDDLEVLLDGAPANLAASAAGRVTIGLPQQAVSSDDASRGTSAHTLELRWRQPSRPHLLTRYRLVPPQISGATSLSQVYWQIILPGDNHIVRSPAQMTPASQWQWLGMFFGRRPVHSQPQLEQWVGATSQIAPADGQAEYLFSSFSPLSSIEIITAPRWLIVLVASSAVIAIACGATYLPILRTSWSLLVVALLIAAAALAYPAAALLIAQASLLGILLGLATVFVARWKARPAALPTPLSIGSSQRTLTPRTDSIIMPLVGAAGSTAPTVTLRMSDSER